MENLVDQIEAEARLKEYLVRIGDFINIDGPLLSLFSDVRNEHLYLYDWADSDAAANRFLIYAIPPQAVLDYLSKKITHRELLSQATGGRYYFADIRPGEFSTYKVFRLKQLPEGYADTENNLFDEQFCENVEKLLLFVIRAREKDSNDFTYYASGFIDCQEYKAWENFSQLDRHEEGRFYNWATHPLLDELMTSESDGQISRPINAEEMYFNDEKWQTLHHVRKDNQLPERKRVEFYRRQTSGVRPF